ncbi:MAG: FMN-binding negative transcriptional regulator [Bryobacteraceae bacterium]
MPCTRRLILPRPAPTCSHRFIREHPLGALIDASLNASHLPMLLDADGRTLRCHMARANETVRSCSLRRKPRRLLKNVTERDISFRLKRKGHGHDDRED